MLRMLRHHRLRARLSLLAISALLWSQMLLAFHADCQPTAMAGSPPMTTMEHADCTQAGDATDFAVCQSHCSQGDASSDTTRTAAVPALAPALPVSLVVVVHLRAHGSVAPAPPRALAGHRPTPHPASVLLI